MTISIGSPHLPQAVIATSVSVPTIHAAIASPATSNRFATIPQAAAVRPFTEPAFRDLKFKANDRKNSRGDIIKGNGTGPAGVWVQIGAKVLVDLFAFDAWLESHRVRGGE
jgi:hypothetical protein